MATGPLLPPSRNAQLASRPVVTRDLVERGGAMRVDAENHAVVSQIRTSGTSRPGLQSFSAQPNHKLHWAGFGRQFRTPNSVLPIHIDRARTARGDIVGVIRAV